MVKLNFNSTEKILYIQGSGTVNAAEMIDVYRKLGGYKKFTEKLLILQDSREAVLKLSQKDIQLILSEFKKVVENFKYIKHAGVHKSPGNVAHAMMYEMAIHPQNYHYKVFSSIESAKFWLTS